MLQLNCIKFGYWALILKKKFIDLGNFYTNSCFTNNLRNRFYSDQFTNDINFLLGHFLFWLVVSYSKK
jgi:hypothetical protein